MYIIFTVKNKLKGPPQRILRADTISSSNWYRADTIPGQALIGVGVLIKEIANHIIYMYMYIYMFIVTNNIGQVDFFAHINNSTCSYTLKLLAYS